MATVSPKALEEFKKIFKEEYGHEFKSEAEAQEAAQNLLNFFEVLYDIAQEEYVRKQRLKKEPKGFHLEEGRQYNCKICHRVVSGKESWWDKYGTKCMDCRRNLEKRVIPKSVCTKRESWYANWELQSKFGIHPSTARKLIREGKLKPRNLKGKDGTIYYRIFLAKENPMLQVEKGRV